MKTSTDRRFQAWGGLLLIALTALLIVGCGGGSGSTSNNGGGGSTGGTATGSLGGMVIKGPVSAATVKAYAVNANGTRGAELGTAQTDASGAFNMTLREYAGPMLLEVQGGSYMDEATGMRMSLLDGDELTCALPAVTVAANSTTSGIQVTPLTSMAQSWAAHMSGGMTMANITMANAHVGDRYVGPGADIVMTHPIDPTVAGSANGASIEAKNYGLMLATMSQLAHDLGMTTSSSAMVTLMLDDASDGIMDGRMGSATISMGGMGGMMGGGTMMASTGTSRMVDAMAAFIGNQAMNHSGVTSVAEMQSWMDRMMQFAASGGRL